MSDTILRQDAIAIIEAASNSGAWASSHVAVSHVIEAINEMPSQPDPTALVEVCRAVVEANNYEAPIIAFLVNLNNVAKRCQNALNAWEQSNG